METKEMEASSNGTSLAVNFFKGVEELSSQISSFNEAMTQSRELEERSTEEIKQQGPRCLELSGMTDQPDYDLETVVNKVESALVQQTKHFSAGRARHQQGPATARAAEEQLANSKKWHQ